MAGTRYVPVFDSRPPSAYLSRLERSLQSGMARLEKPRNSDNPEDFILHEDSDGEEERTMPNTPYNCVDYIRNREYGNMSNIEYEYRSVNKHYGTMHILTHDLFKEWSIPFKTMNKVLCSKWLNSNQIVFGTKCNKVSTLNTYNYSISNIYILFI